MSAKNASFPNDGKEDGEDGDDDEVGRMRAGAVRKKEEERRNCFLRQQTCLLPAAGVLSSRGRDHPRRPSLPSHSFPFLLIQVSSERREIAVAR